MKKEFTSRPIRLKEKNKYNEKERSKEKFPDFYENENEYAKIEKPKNGYGIWVLVVFVSAFFGFGSSLAYSFLFADDVGSFQNQNFIIEKKQQVTVTNEENLQLIKSEINPAIVNFYKKPTQEDGPFYQDKNSIGTGFVLTSNGWLVSTKSIFEGNENQNKITDVLAIDSNYRIYKIERIVQDEISDVVFVKIDANDLVAAKLGDFDKIFSGQGVYVFLASFPRARIASLHIADLETTTLGDVVASTEKINHFLSVIEGYDKSLVGAPIVNMSGEVIAIVNNTQIATPVAYLKTAISEIIKKGEVNRVYFGVNYINLAKYPKIDIEKNEARKKGALLSGIDNLTAVEKGSPADKAGFMVGDIITMVEDEIVNGRKTLTQIVQDYRVGTKVNMTVIRNGKERMIEVEFD